MRGEREAGDDERRVCRVNKFQLKRNIYKLMACVCVSELKIIFFLDDVWVCFVILSGLALRIG
jgi:hypothetical protein